MSVIRFTNQNHVGWLEFNRPPVNAFTREMVDEVHDALLATLADPGVRVMVLASAVERYFSAGADLNVFKGMKADGMRQWATRCHDIVRLLRTSSKPLATPFWPPAPNLKLSTPQLSNLSRNSSMPCVLRKTPLTLPAFTAAPTF